MLRSTLALAFLGALLASVAGAQDGSASLSGTGKIKVKPDCGKDRQLLTGTWPFSAGTWSATSSGDPVLSGTSTPLSGNGKKWLLAFDAPSKIVFDDALASWASAVCGAPVTLTQPPSVTHFDLKLDKRRTRAKLKLLAFGLGSTAFGTGRGKYKAILRGAWIDLP